MNTKSVPVLFCEIINGAGDFMIIWILLEFSMATVMRFLFVFVWKQVYTIDDTLVAWLISALNIAVSLCLMAADVYIGNHRTTMWFVCAGPQIHPVAYKDPAQLSGVLVAFIVLTFVYILFGVRYAWYKIGKLLKK